MAKKPLSDITDESGGAPPDGVIAPADTEASIDALEKAAAAVDAEAKDPNPSDQASRVVTAYDVATAVKRAQDKHGQYSSEALALQRLLDVLQ